MLRTIKEKKLALADFPVRPDELAELINRVKRGELNTNQGREVLGRMIETGEAAEAIIAKGGYQMVSDRDAIAAAVDAAIAANPQAIEELKKGKKKPEAVKGFLRGQVMKQTGGKANPALVGELLETKLADLSFEAMIRSFEPASMRADQAARRCREPDEVSFRACLPELVQLARSRTFKSRTVGFRIVILGIEPDGEHPGCPPSFDVGRLAVADHGRLAARAAEPFDGDLEEGWLRACRSPLASPPPPRRSPRPGRRSPGQTGRGRPGTRLSRLIAKNDAPEATARAAARSRRN